MRSTGPRFWKHATTAMISLSLSVMGGCGQYWRNRAADLGDIVTVAGGVGLGVTAQAGPAASGLGLVSDMIGIRGGAPCLTMQPCPSRSTYPRPLFGSSSGAFIFIYADEIYYPQESKSPQWYHHRNKDGGHVSVFFAIPVDVMTDQRGWTYYTNFEVAAGLGVSARLGFNPGELLDFLVGWFGVDLANDDRSAPSVPTASPAHAEPPQTSPLAGHDIKAGP